MRATWPLLLIVAASVLPAAAGAQTVTHQSAAPRAAAGGILVYPLTLLTKGNLDFGLVASPSGGGGTVIVNPVTSKLSVTGPLLALGGNPRPASFVGASKNAAVVIIRIPKSPITIRRSGGTETMLVRDFTLDGQDKRTLARAQAFEFNVGATLVVNAGQAEGVYSGEFDVTVQYP